MIHKKLKLINNLGLHARAAAKLVNCASHYGCKIEIKHHARRVNAKSILGIMTLGAAKGAELEISLEGEEEQAALHAIEELVNNRFGEED